MICCALRFDGYAYLKSAYQLYAEPDDEVSQKQWQVVVNPVVTQLALHQRWEDNFLAFFLLQRRLFTSGEESLPESSPEHVAFCFLFLHVYGQITPERYHNEEFETRWFRQYAGRAETLAAQVRQALLKAEDRGSDVEPQLALPFREAASWVMASELVRRAPDRLRLIETHPGGGLYDCLSVMSGHQQLCAFNRAGRLHFFSTLDGQATTSPPMALWCALEKGESTRLLLDTICQQLRIPIPNPLPPGNSASLTYRAIAAFLKLNAFGLHAWRCTNGFYDSSGGHGGRLSDFAQFPGANERLQQREREDLLGEPAYRFWFLQRDQQSMACLETTGMVWSGDGSTINLPKIYAQNRNITSVVAALAERVLTSP